MSNRLCGSVQHGTCAGSALPAGYSSKIETGMVEDTTMPDSIFTMKQA